MSAIPRKAGTRDPARYLVNPGSVTAPGQHTPGGMRHARPYLVNGSQIFIFPATEGFRRSGTATLGLHHYIGDNTVAGFTLHYEEGRIEMSGTFPGTTSRDQMVGCLSILRSVPPDDGLVLYVPGVFERQQYVLAENWDFSHDPTDYTHSITYTISFVRLGEGSKVKDPHGNPPPPSPAAKSKPRGKPQRIFTTKDGARSLRTIAKIVYGNQNQWQKLVSLNQGQLNDWKKDHEEIPAHKLPTFRWPIGTKFRY